MPKKLWEFVENVSAACKRSKRQFRAGFGQGAMRAMANDQLKELKKVTPRSDKTDGEHAADAWNIEYDIEDGIIVGFEITNPHDRIDWLEYGTKDIYMILPVRKQALHFYIDGDEIFADHVFRKGLEPMGFVRGVQDNMMKKVPYWIRRTFDSMIEKEWD